MYRLRISGNFFLILQDSDQKEHIRHPKKDISYLIFDENDSNPLFRFEGLEEDLEPKLGNETEFRFSSLRNESGTAFVNVSALKTFLDDNLGNSSGGGSGSGAVNPRSEHRFANVAARDTYFTNNPSDLRAGLPIYVTISSNTDLQIWSGEAQATYVTATDAPKWADAGTFTGTGAQIKTLLFAEPDTNNLSNSLLAKLNGLPVDSVRYGAQTLTTGQQSQARQNINAAMMPTTPTITPTPPPIQGGNILALQTSTFDASGSTFPSGGSAGFVYRVSTSGTVDSISFGVEDLLVQLIDSASTTVFTGNWYKIDGATFHSWGGLMGVVDDRMIEDKLRALRFLKQEGTTTLTGNFTINSSNAVTNDRTLFITGSSETVDRTITIAAGLELDFIDVINLGTGDLIVAVSGSERINGQTSITFDTNKGGRIKLATTGVYNVIFSNSEEFDLSTHSVTELNDVTNAGSGQIITAAERSKLSGLEQGFRGNFSTTSTYLQGQTVRSNYQGRPAIYMAAAALQASTTLPEARLDSGFWFLVTDRTWRGNWVASDYVPGQVVLHSSELWMVISIIGVSDTNPPSSTNTSWRQITGGSGGGTTLTVQNNGTDLSTDADTLNFNTRIEATGSSATKTLNIDIKPTLVFNRNTNRTLSGLGQYTHVVCDDSGTTTQNVTMEAATANNAGNVVKIINNRANVNGQVIVSFPSGTTIRNMFGTTITLVGGQSIEFTYIEAGIISITGEADTTIVPNFPPNPQNNSNTFQFGVNADNPTTWLRDRNTSINLNRSTGSGESYDLANPNTSGITVANGDGNVFRKIGTLPWSIRPFASNNLFYIGDTQYTNASPYSLASQNTLVVIYNSTTSRWEGQVFTSLVGGTSGVGASGSSEDSEITTTASYAVYEQMSINGNSTSVKKGEFAHINGFDGNIEARKSSLSLSPMGIFMNDAEDREDVNILFKGGIDNVDVWDGTGYATSVVSNNTPVYFDTVGQRPNLVQMDGNTTRSELGKVFGSFETMSTQIGRTLGTDYANAASGEVQLSLNKNNEFGGQGTSTYHLPTGYVEGIGGFNEVVDGVKIAIEITPNSGQSGIVNVRPGANTLLKLKSNETVTYTSGSPLIMNSSVGKQYRIFEYRASDNTWLALENGEDVIKISYHFDITRFNTVNIAQALYEQSVNIQSNTTDVATLKNWNRVPVVTNYTLSNLNNVFFDVVSVPNDNSRTFTIGTSHGLTTQRINRYYIRNSSSDNWVKIINANGNFADMSDDEIWLKPGETREFIGHFDGTTYRVTVLGKVFYDFSLETGLFTSNSIWTLKNTNTIIDQILEIPSVNQDRIQVKVPCKIENFRVDMGWLFTAGAQTASTTLNFGGQPSDGTTVTLDTVTYTFKDTLDNGVANQVKIGTQISNTSANFRSAVLLTGTAGTDYSTPTVIHPTVTSNGGSNNTVNLQAKAAGVAGNSLAASTSGSGVSISAFTGGTVGEQATSISNLTSYKCTPDFRRNGTSIQEGHTTKVLNMVGAENSYHQEIDILTTMNANDYLEIKPANTSATQVTGTGVNVRGTIVLKEN